METAVFNQGTRPNRFVRIRAPKIKDHQRRWVVAACRDDRFDADLLDVVRGRINTSCSEVRNELYDHFWPNIGALASDRQTTWVACFRLRHALDKSKWLEALASGEIKLPTRKAKNGEKKRSGKISLSASCAEIDLVIKGKKIKLIDLENYALSLPDDAGSLNDLQIDQATALFGCLIAAADLVDLSISKSTAAQIGYTKLRQLSCDNLILSAPDVESRELERRAYYGGRNECFFLGDYPGRVYSFDIKSCYAAICRSARLPMMLVAEYKVGLDCSQIEMSYPDFWSADCIIRTDSPYYPCRFNGQTVYPIGEFATTLCGAELHHAIDRESVVKIIRAARYFSSSFLSNYAEWFLAAKNKLSCRGLAAVSGFLKCAFNSSLGFFARRKYQWQPIETPGGPEWFIGRMTSPDDRQTAVQAHILDSKCEWLNINGEPSEAMPIVHAAICAEARIKLLDIMMIAGSDNVLYVDTDGLLVNSDGAKNLIRVPGVIGGAPGQLQERFNAGTCRIQGQKNYRLGNQIVCAGLPEFRKDQWTQMTNLATSTGQVCYDGSVYPFNLSCEDVGGVEPRYVNRLITE